MAVEPLFNISLSADSFSIAMILAGEHALQPPEPTAAEVREGVDDVAKKITGVNKKYFHRWLHVNEISWERGSTWPNP